MRHLVFSIAPRWIDEILAGRKTYELRRRPPQLPETAFAYLYETSPHCRIRAKCLVGPIVSKPLSDLWQAIGAQSRVDEHNFFRYFSGLEMGHAIALSDVIDLGLDFTLARLKIYNFHPPQSWCRASDEVVSLIGGTP